MKRRSFLSLFAAAPVVAQEAAAKMGLSSMVSAASMPAVGVGHAIGASPASSDDSWVKRAIAEYWSPQARRERENEAAHAARVLDPDLASMRSLSPSAAYSLQRARCLERIETERLAWYRTLLN